MSPLTLFVPLMFIGTAIKSKSKKAGAIFDLVWSLGIFIWGMEALSDGYSISLFGVIELPGPLFLVLIGVIMVSEIVSLVGTFREKPAEPVAAVAQAEEETQN